MTDTVKHQLKHEAMALVRVVEQILRRWDPIGVDPGVLAPADEYDSYAPHIVSMLAAGCSVDVLARHLQHIRTDLIGLPANLNRDTQCAIELLASWKHQRDGA